MSSDRVDILAEGTDEVMFTCQGPTATGRCPHTDLRGVVACAGYRIAATGAGPEYWKMSIPPNSQHCPLAWNLEYVGM